MRSPATTYRQVWGDHGVRIERSDTVDTAPEIVRSRTDLHHHADVADWTDQASAEAAQAALDLLADFFGDDDRALELHQRLRWDLLTEGTEELDGMTIIEWSERL